MSYYVCSTFDVYDPVSGFFVTKIDCIEWNEDYMGVWNGPKYATKAECYAQSICTQAENDTVISISNNYCNMVIDSVSLIDKSFTTLTFNINIEESYYNTYIQYALYDINFNQLTEFKTINNTSNPLPITSTLTITDNFNDVCAVAFRLLRPCESISGSIGSGSGESGSEDSGGNNTQCNGILQDCFIVCEDNCTTIFGTPIYDSNGCQIGCDFGGLDCSTSSDNCNEPDPQPPEGSEVVDPIARPNTPLKCANLGYFALEGPYLPIPDIYENIVTFDGNCYHGYYLMTDSKEQINQGYRFVNYTPIDIILYISCNPLVDIYNIPPNPWGVYTVLAGASLNFTYTTTQCNVGSFDWHLYWKPVSLAQVNLLG